MTNIQKVVEEIRKKFENREVSHEELVKLYLEYNPSVDGNMFVKEAEKIFPDLNCGLTSVYLKSIIGGEIINGKYLDHNHTFLKLEGKIIDITADQYGGPRIYIGDLKYPWSE